jgi:hypothetical protein
MKDDVNLSLAKWIKYQYRRRFHGHDRCASPIFIVGCGHSGTSLLLAVLGSHPNLFPIPYESGFAFSEDPAPLLRRFDRVTIAEGKKRWIEKTPRHILRIDRLLHLYPQSRILWMIRDGRDVAVSIRDRSGSLEEGIKRWVEDNCAATSYSSHSNILLVKYEDLVTAFEETARGVLAFLSEPFASEVLEYHSTPKHFYSETVAKPPTPAGSNHVQYRNWQINQPIFDGRGKWQTLTAEERALIKGQASDLLASYGYADSNSW